MEKTEKILDFIEHPERYSDEEIKSVLSDEESRKLYNTMAETAAAMDMDISKIDVNEEWRKFAAAHSDLVPRKPRFTLSRRGMMRIAAVLAGVVMLSGVSFAAYHYIKTIRSTSVSTQNVAHTDVSAPKTLPADTTKVAAVAKPVMKKTFINITLGKMLPQIAEYYNIKVVFNNASIKDLRIYYDFDSRKGINKIVNELNQFENVNLSLKDNTLTAE